MGLPSVRIHRIKGKDNFPSQTNGREKSKEENSKKKKQ